MVIGQVERLLQRRGIVSAVVAQTGGGLVGELVVANEILQPELGGIHLELGRQQIHHALDAMRGFGPARPAVGVGGNTIGKYTYDVRVDVAELVEARHHQDGKRGNRRRE